MNELELELTEISNLRHCAKLLTQSLNNEYANFLNRYTDGLIVDNNVIERIKAEVAAMSEDEFKTKLRQLFDSHDQAGFTLYSAIREGDDSRIAAAKKDYFRWWKN